MIRRALLFSMFAVLLAPLAANAQNTTGPELGSSVDDFSLQDQHGKSHKLSDLVAKGPVALVVFRSADW